MTNIAFKATLIAVAVLLITGCAHSPTQDPIMTMIFVGMVSAALAALIAHDATRTYYTRQPSDIHA